MERNGTEWNRMEREGTGWDGLYNSEREWSEHRKLVNFEDHLLFCATSTDGAEWNGMRGKRMSDTSGVKWSGVSEMEGIGVGRTNPITERKFTRTTLPLACNISSIEL